MGAGLQAGDRPGATSAVLGSWVLRASDIRRKLPIAARCSSASRPSTPLPRLASTTQDVGHSRPTPRCLANPAGTLQTLRDLGVNMIRVNVTWNAIAPSALSTKRPKRASTPPTPPPTRPAAGRRTTRSSARPRPTTSRSTSRSTVPRRCGRPARARPKSATGYFREDWEPSAKEFGYFVKAVGTRYSGSYKPAGLATALPRVSFWSIWNEPNYGYDIAPQGTGRNQSIPNSPHIYRNLVDAAWSSLQATGHTTRRDKILFGEVTPHGVNALGRVREHEAADLPALAVLRRLELPRAAGLGREGPGLPDDGGRIAQLPQAEPGAVQRQRVCRPSLRGGVAAEPCRPTCAGTKLCAGAPSDPDFADLPEVPRLERTLDRLNADLRLAHALTRCGAPSTASGPGRPTRRRASARRTRRST